MHMRENVISVSTLHDWLLMINGDEQVLYLWYAGLAAKISKSVQQPRL